MVLSVLPSADILVQKYFGGKKIEESILAHHSCIGSVKRFEQVTNLMNIHCTTTKLAHHQHQLSFAVTLLDVDTLVICTLRPIVGRKNGNLGYKVVCSVLSSSDSHALRYSYC